MNTDISTWPDYLKAALLIPDARMEALQTAANEIARLCAVVDKLPLIWRLVDGKLVRDVPAYPGMRVYNRFGFGYRVIAVDAFDVLIDVGTKYEPLREPYANKEAAEAAMKQDRP